MQGLELASQISACGIGQAVGYGGLRLFGGRCGQSAGAADPDTRRLSCIGQVSRGYLGVQHAAEQGVVPHFAKQQQQG